MRKWMKGLAMVGMVGVGAVACDGSGTEPVVFDAEAVTAEAALVAADAMFRDLDLAQDPGLEALGFGGMGGGPGMGGPQGGGQCQGTEGQGTFSCGSMVRGGFTITREVTFFDAAGQEQPDGFDEATTDAVHMIMTSSGSVERSFWSASMERTRDMFIRGLLGEAHTLNGSGSGSVFRSGNPLEGLEKVFDMSTEATWTDVVHLQPREDHPYPESGTVERHILVTVTENGDVVGSRDVEALVTFNGTRYVTMVVDGESFEIDLANREVQGRFGGGGRNG